MLVPGRPRLRRSDPLLPPSLIVSRRLSVSTSFVLAALRALHVDTSHAPRSDRQDGGKGGTTTPGQAQVVTAAPASDPRTPYEQPAMVHARCLDRGTAHQPNSPSCGNQSAHIRLTTRRYRHARHHLCGIRSPKRCPRRRSWTPLHPAHLTSRPPYQSVSRGSFGWDAVDRPGARSS